MGEHRSICHTFGPHKRSAGTKPCFKASKTISIRQDLSRSRMLVLEILQSCEALDTNFSGARTKSHSAPFFSRIVRYLDIDLTFGAYIALNECGICEACHQPQLGLSAFDHANRPSLTLGAARSMTNILRRGIAMALNPPKDPLVAVIGATGTGKSKVMISLLYRRQKLTAAGSWQSSLRHASMARSSTATPCRCTMVCP